MLRMLGRKMWRKMILLSLAGVSAAALSGDAYSQDVDLKALLERVERLERQNRELQNKLASQPVATQPVATETGVDARTIENVVSNYLANQAKMEEVKKKEEAKKQPEFVAVGSDLNVKTTWKDGISFATTNGDFKVHVGGRVHFDMGWFETFDDIDDTAFKDAAGFRRARLRVDGTCWEVINWVAEFDFGNPDSTDARSTFTDVYMEITQLPWIGNFRAGRFKEPFSIEWLNSSRYMNTMERSLPFNAFNPQRTLGVMVMNTIGAQERGTWAASLGRTDGNIGNGDFDAGDGEYAVTCRATALPYWAHEGRCLVHVGAAWSNRNHNLDTDPADGTHDPIYSSRTSVREGGNPALVSTGPLTDIESVDLYNAEVAANFGPVNFNAELIGAQNHTNVLANGNPFYWGGYVQASYFLTGEHRPYNKKGGFWDRVRPIEPFYLVRGGNDDEGRRVLFGRGAWEFVARWAYLDLTSDGRDPLVGFGSTTPFGTKGVLQDLTLGLNWYFNPNFKWQVNYVRAWRDLVDPDRGNAIVDALGMRFAWDF